MSLRLKYLNKIKCTSLSSAFISPPPPILCPAESTKACSEPDLRSDLSERPPAERSADGGACAVLVDVEEVVAAPLEDIPPVRAQEPIYSYAPDEVTRLIDSSGRSEVVIGQWSIANG